MNHIGASLKESVSLHSTEVEVGKDQEFVVNTRGAGGQGKVDVKITSPSKRPIPCKVQPDMTNSAYSVHYIPPEEGPYKVDVSYDGNPVPGSPFTVEGVIPPDPSKASNIQQFALFEYIYIYLFSRHVCP